MKVCVLVKEVPDRGAPRAVDRLSGRLDRRGERSLDPASAHAVRVAAHLRAAGVVDEVVAVTMAPAEAARTLLRAVALGADRAIHLVDPALAGSDLPGTARALSAVLGAEAPDLVLLGATSDDAACGAMAGAVGELLGVPSVAGVVSLGPSDGGLMALRRDELGEATLRVTAPALVALTVPSGEVPFPGLRAMRAARERPSRQVTLAEIGVDPQHVGDRGAGVSCGDPHPAPERRGGRIVDGADADGAVAEIVGWLEGLRLLGPRR